VSEGSHPGPKDWAASRKRLETGETITNENSSVGSLRNSAAGEFPPTVIQLALVQNRYRLHISVVPGRYGSRRACSPGRAQAPKQDPHPQGPGARGVSERFSNITSCRRISPPRKRNQQPGDEYSPAHRALLAKSPAAGVSREEALVNPHQLDSKFTQMGDRFSRCVHAQRPAFREVPDVMLQSSAHQ